MSFAAATSGGGADTLGELFTRPTWQNHSTRRAWPRSALVLTAMGVGVNSTRGYFAARRALYEVSRD